MGHTKKNVKPNQSQTKPVRASERTNKGQPAQHLRQDYVDVPGRKERPILMSTPMPITKPKSGLYRFPSDESVVEENITVKEMPIGASNDTKSVIDDTIKNVQSDQMPDLMKELVKQMKQMSTQNDDIKQQLSVVNARLNQQDIEVRLIRNEKANPSMPQFTQPIAKNLGAIPKKQNVIASEPNYEEVVFNNMPPINDNQTPQNLNMNMSQPSFANRSEARRTLHDLPVFTGVSEEWPMFLGTLNETTQAYQYTNLENLIRLQKCLQGKARQVVESMLVHPNNVPYVVEELQFRFGRSEQLIKSQIDKIRKVPRISDENYSQLIEYSSKIRNFVAYMMGANAEFQLHNPQLLEELVAKLPNNRRVDWAFACSQIQGSASIANFADWLFNIAKVVSLIETSGNRAATEKKFTLHASDSSNKDNENTVKCTYCSRNHKIFECPAFLKISVKERWNWVKTKKACFSCLNIGHQVMACRKKKNCDKDGCNKRHHNLLHEPKVVIPTEEEKPTPNTVLNVHQSCEEVYFKVIPVTVFGPNDERVNTFAILDDASSMSFMDTNLAKELNLAPRESKDIELSWLDDTVAKRKTIVVNCKIRGKSQGYAMQELKKVHLLDDLSLPRQSMKMNELTKQYPQLMGLPLKNFTNAKPRILIGLNNARLGYVQNYVDCPPNGPMAIETPLGWILYGPNQKSSSEQPNHVLFIHESLREEYDKLHDTVDKYYENENFGVVKPRNNLESDENVRARQLLEATIRQTNNGYETGLLWKEDNIQMPVNYNSALKRLETLEKKMQKDQVYAANYRNAMKQFIDKGYARRLSTKEASETTSKSWYLPHFGVVNPNKPGKIRIVFDAAAATSGVSLNSQLLKGPDLNQPLSKVLSYFREGEIAVIADIREMFLQMKVRDEDQDAQRFLLKEDGEVDTYVMESVIFGATCSPTVAQYVKNKNAEKYQGTHPNAVEAIIENHYVDDFVKSFPNEDCAISVSQSVVKIHREAKFELRNFVSNSELVMKILNGSETSSQPLKDLNIESGLHTEKVLGMYWDHVNDEFVFDLKFYKVNPAVLNQERNPTKREMLSLAMSIFDPFGFLGNFHICPKILIQKLWKLPIDWDEAVPEEISKMWYQWQSELSKLKDFKVPRCYSVDLPQAIDIQLHLFVDASQDAYAAVSYWRITTVEKTTIAFIYGKSRVAPQKLLSIPRLELQAAVLGVRMKESVIESHTIKPSKIVYWTDSTTVKHWINTGSHKYKPFVAHRLAEILECSSAQEWNWIPTKLNPSDDATRAKFPVNYNPMSRWLTGPEFLTEEEDCWPNYQMPIDCEIAEEVRKTSHVLMVKEIDQYAAPQFSRFSKYLRLVRTMAWIFRYKFNLRAVKNKKPRLSGELTASELNEAELYLCKIVQETTFVEEYVSLRRGESVSTSSKLYHLSPFLHSDGLIRVNGRIKAATSVPLETKLPIILPGDHYFTHLLVARYHEQCHHQNQETVVVQLRQKFWIPSIRPVVKKVKSNCQVCKLKKTKPQQPIMGQLPFDRVASFERPFTYTGLDYFGPYNIVIGRSVVKRWVAIFTCSTYRAVHLEVAFDLSTDACILCLRNFFNIRGVPKRIRSDNGTNFVGLKGELCNVNDFLDHDKVKSELAPFGIEWIFNSPADPSAGGSWERLVQSIKRAMSSTIEKRSLQEHTFRSLLCEAMNIVNSRPLTHVPVSPEDPEPLTPNHFLIGEMNSTHCHGPFNERLICVRKQWRISQQLKNHFYTRWLQEYLPMLTRRCKWFKEVEPLKEDQLVVICDSDQSRSKWQMGRIIEVVKAKDGQVRQAVVKTSTGVLRRPANKLAVLEVEVNLGESPRGRECQQPLTLSK